MILSYKLRIVGVVNTRQILFSTDHFCAFPKESRYTIPTSENHDFNKIKRYLPDNFYPIICLYFTADYYFCKDPLFRHDAVADGIEYIAPVVTDLADLCHFQEDATSDF